MIARDPAVTKFGAIPRQVVRSPFPTTHEIWLRELCARFSVKPASTAMISSTPHEIRQIDPSSAFSGGQGQEHPDMKL